MSNSPLVSVICLCHNQETFVKEAIQSVWAQTHSSVELIVVDDGSTDASKSIIQELLSDTKTTFISIEEPVGNCAAFNRGLKASLGAYIIDLAADDVLLSQRVEKGLAAFSNPKIGVEYCNVRNIDQHGEPLHTQFTLDQQPPQGDVYLDLITRFFISAPGMMMKREVLEVLNGYDELLSYEDFDFWIRSSRTYYYAYTSEILVKKRLLPSSLSKKQFRFLSKHQKSTLRVCQKIKSLNTTDKEHAALRHRCQYEIRQCIRQGNVHLIPAFIKLIFS